ncbi:MAG: type III-B CRISPR module RAMP protein Cmr6 [Chloroflexi bacterium]|nr:type III-B CRISPR module RAMP protein Cmr6 [Chloroflexota bacterium]
MAKNLKPIPEPEFLIPSDLPALDFVPPVEDRRKDGLKTTNVVRTSNFGLLISRFIPHQVVRNEKNDAIIEIRNNGKEGVYQTLRSHWFEHLPQNFTQANPEIASLIASTHQRWLAMTEGAARFTMVSRSRMIVGLGGKGALEFGITLHPVTGLPYIPGSALKGLCRNYALYYIAEQSGISLDPAQVKNTSEVANQLDEQLTGIKDYRLKVHPEYAALYRNLFGTQAEAGQCVFYDAVISRVPESLFAVEVMTPHFRKYYESGGKDAPHDADEPKSITYIAVNAGIAFRFAIGLRHNASLSRESILGDARSLLMEALQLMGIGAKTAAGYGVFYDPKAK